MARRRPRGAGMPDAEAGAAPARRGAPRWMVVLGLFVYCSLCWTLVVVVTQSAFRQFAPHETLAQQGARADELARR